MLELFIPPRNDLFDENTEEFLVIEGGKLQLEHSLISIRKWEAIWNKPYLGKAGMEEEPKTNEELFSYIQCMTLNHVEPTIYYGLTPELVDRLVAYLKAPMTAAWFNDSLIGASKNKNETVTAETIYWWMFELGIPLELERWHLNQLLTLIKFVFLKRQPPKKMSRQEAAIYREKLNQERRAKYNSKG